MEAAHGPLLFRKRNIALHGKFMDSVLREFLTTPHHRKEPSLVMQKLRLQYEAVTYRAGSEFNAKAFLQVRKHTNPRRLLPRRRTCSLQIGKVSTLSHLLRSTEQTNSWRLVIDCFQTSLHSPPARNSAN